MLAAPEVSYLGHHVMRDGLLPDPSLLWAISKILGLQNVKELQSFLGLVSYYFRYVKGFSAIASLLHAFTKKDAVFHWTPECQDNFVKLTMASIAAFPDFDLLFQLYMDTLPHVGG